MRRPWTAKLMACGLLGATGFLLGWTKLPPDAKPDDIKPPGDCEDAAYAVLDAAVDKACKINNPVEACLRSDACGVLAKKAIAFDDCAKARQAREDKCFRGGNKGHKQQITEMSNGRATCLSRYSSTRNACRSRTRPPVNRQRTSKHGPSSAHR